MVPPQSTTSTLTTSSRHANMMGPSGGSGGHAGKPPLPHIDDLLNPVINIDAFAPIESVIAQGENHLRSAESFKSFGRPHLALKEYVSATMVAVEAVPRNKAFSALSDRRQLAARHTALMRKIHALHPEFEQIKSDIKLDNQKSGVQPLAAAMSPTLANGGGRQLERHVNGNAPVSKPPGHANGDVVTPRSSQDSTNSSEPWSPGKRPTLQSKPQALHGNSIKPAAPAATASAASGQDLVERFAKLRGGKLATNVSAPQSSNAPNTRPSPREVAGISLASNLPDLPKMPEAIYSPARGTVSNESANLPSSNSRGMFSRTASSAALSTQAKPPFVKEDYFAPAQPKAPVVAPRPKVVIPEGDTVSAEELMGFMRASSSGFKVLIIDVRTREEFDEGHIMSQSIICVEPDILQREHISADDIAESLVLAPPQEEKIFSKRNEYDLVVFYNQDSEEINWRGGTPAENALLGLYNALRHFDYDLTGDSKPAKLLKGGIEAWTGLVGEYALQRSNTASAGDKDRPAMAAMAAKPINRQPSNHVRPKARPIQNAEDARRWEETVSDMENSLVRSHDEFLRRFPSVGAIQESMSSPVAPPKPRHPGSADIYSTLPPPPARPAPAVPRQSYSGLRETGEEEPYAATTAGSRATGRKDTKRPVGLVNPGPWCYANASIQALFQSAGFVDEFAGNEWQTRWQVPKRAEERLDNPQLLTKIMANLFHWMENGQFEVMECKTLMEYCNFIDRKTTQLDGCGRNVLKGPSLAFGSRDTQQDAEEFMNFLMDHLHDETNCLRDQNYDPSTVQCEGDRYEHAMAHWKGYCGANRSVIDKYWRGLSQKVLKCTSCGHTTYGHEFFNKIQVSVPENKSASFLPDMLRAGYPERETRDDYKCDKCKKKNTTICTDRLARLPELLCISLSRFRFESGHSSKINTKVMFPINDLDLTPISDATPSDRAQGAEWSGPFRYYCYAAIIHSGTLKYGHYTAFVRDQNSAIGDGSWYYCNDRTITQKTIQTDAAADSAGMYASSNDTSAYILFYRRRPVGR